MYVQFLDHKYLLSYLYLTKTELLGIIFWLYEKKRWNTKGSVNQELLKTSHYGVYKGFPETCASCILVYLYPVFPGDKGKENFKMWSLKTYLKWIG